MESSANLQRNIMHKLVSKLTAKRSYIIFLKTQVRFEMVKPYYRSTIYGPNVHYLICKLGHVALQSGLVVSLLTHLY